MENGKVLITFITQRKDEDAVVKAAMKAGAPGLTSFYARGTGVRQKLGLLGMFIEAEKVVTMCVMEQDKSDGLIDAVLQSTGLDKMGRIFIYVTPVTKVVGFLSDN
ncbi:MAG TPA: P-II family nitrogen regulator [Elusimicrobiales bacterium]|nr:P-II family nitrogen regulator [Elusimicrobiales bacterium]